MADSGVAKTLIEFQRLVMVIEVEQRLLAILALEQTSVVDLVGEFTHRSVLHDGDLPRLGAVREVNE